MRPTRVNLGTDVRLSIRKSSANFATVSELTDRLLWVAVTNDGSLIHLYLTQALTGLQILLSWTTSY